jgi:exosome complex component RRP41
VRSRPTGRLLAGGWPGGKAEQSARNAMELTSLRGDGRRAHEVRRVECAFGVVGDCDGSALVVQGLTKVVASVHGPREVARARGPAESAEHSQRQAVVRCEVSQAAFSTADRRRRRAGDKRASAIASLVEETFAHVVQTGLFGRSEINVSLHILQADGGVLPASICAASLALAHAGVPMSDLVACCSIGYLDGHVVLDLNHAEEQTGCPQLALTLMPRSSQVLTLRMESSAQRVSVELLDQLTRDAQIGCHQIAKIMDAKLRELVAEAFHSQHVQLMRDAEHEDDQ